jgi:hypothetical protein
MKPREVSLKSVGVLVAMFAIPGLQSGAQLPASHGAETDTDTYAYDNQKLTPEQQLGRDTGISGQPAIKFWRRAAITGRDVDLQMYVDSEPTAARGSASSTIEMQGGARGRSIRAVDAPIAGGRTAPKSQHPPASSLRRLTIRHSTRRRGISRRT